MRDQDEIMLDGLPQTMRAQFVKGKRAPRLAIQPSTFGDACLIYIGSHRTDDELFRAMADLRADMWKLIGKRWLPGRYEMTMMCGNPTCVRLSHIVCSELGGRSRIYGGKLDANTAATARRVKSRLNLTSKNAGEVSR